MRRAREHLLGRSLGVHREAAVSPLVDGRHQPQLRVEAVQLAAVVLASGSVDVDPERARRLEQPDLRRLAARLPGPIGGELGGRAGRDRAAEEPEHGIGRDRRLHVAVRLRGRARRVASRPHRAHPVLGQRARLVGADDGRRAERLDRAQPLDERAAASEARDPDRERERERRQQPLGDVGDDQADREREGVLERQPGGEPADRQEGEAGGDGDEGDQPRDPPDLLLERALLGLDALGQGGDPAELGLHAGGEDERLAPRRRRRTSR